MSTDLETQSKKLPAKSRAATRQDMERLLLALTQSHKDMGDSLEVCNREKTELVSRLTKEREEISRRELHLAASQQISQTGSWEFDVTNIDDIDNNRLYWSDEAFRIMGFDPGGVEVSSELFFSRVHPGDRVIIKGAISTAIETGKIYDLEHRLVLPGGIEKIVRERSEIILDKQTGRPMKMIGTVQDITAIKNAGAQLEKTNHELHTLFENMQEGFFSVDMEARQMVQMSKACEKIWGYRLEDFYKNPDLWFEAVLEEDKHIILANNPVMHAGRPFSQQFRIRHKDGSTRWLETKITPTINSGGRLTRIDGMSADITEKKEAEAEFYQSEKRYRQIVETAQEGIWTIDENNKTDFVNKKICDILGYSAAEMEGKELFDFMDGDGKEYAAACMERRRKGAKENLDIRYVTKTGKNVWANISANPIFGEDGTYKGSLAMVADITERKHHEELLQKSEANLRTIFDNADSSYVLVDAALKVASFNSHAEAVMRQLNNKQLAEGQCMLDYFPPERQLFLKDVVSRVMNGEVICYEMALEQPDGAVTWLDIKWAGAINKEDRKWGIIFTSNDITEKKMVSLERERVTADLIERNKDLQQFNYIVSHNLRAPVANMMGLSTLLAGRQSDTPGTQELLEGISLSTKKLDEIIKDLNLILQVREGCVHEKKETVYFLQLVDDIKMSISNIMAKEKVQVVCNFEEAGSLFTIRSYLYSIFYNLILNAIKYRQPGIAPVINIRSFKHKDKIQLVFEDNGKGIDMGRNEKHLFGLYKRFDTMVEGKGIGLYMVKSQVETLGGKITLESKVNKGTILRMELPV